LIAYFRNAVGVRQTTRSQTGQDGFELIRLKADQIEGRTGKVEVPELVTEPLEVPARPRRQLVVGQAISTLLLLLQPLATITGIDRQLQLLPQQQLALRRRSSMPFSSTSGGMVHPNSTMEAAILLMSASV